MKKDSFEKLDDGFLNVYEEWIFVRCFEWSAILISEITGYRLFANIDKKTWFIFLEVWFPKNKQGEIMWNLENRWHAIRFVEKNWKLNCIIWKEKLERIEEKIINIKKQLTKFTYDNIW